VKASTLYRIAALLLLLFAAGHTFGFSKPDPTWGVDALVSSMRSTHFDVMGANRSYWDFFLGSGYSVAVFLVFSTVLAWQLGGLPVDTLARMRVIAWAFALCFFGIMLLSFGYFFIIPRVFTTAITLCLIAAAWVSQKKVGQEV